MTFLDRNEERARLMRLLDSSEGALACLYGRRRCGKTRLLHECVKGRGDCLYFTADRSERSAQLLRFAREAARLMPAFRSASPVDWGAALDFWMDVAPRNAILVLDEFPYLVEKDESLPSVLQRICDVLPQTGRKVLICGSSQRMMQGFVLKASEPLYGRAGEILPIRPLDFEWMKDAFPALSAFERLKAWGVWGGVPRYWELQAGEDGLWPAVRRHVASPLGLLHNEPQFLLMDDVADVSQASTVLSFIGDGAHRISEIASRMNRPATDLSRPVQRLLELGLVEKDVPFAADWNGKKSFYRIADPFLDFWYTYVWPNWSHDDFLASAGERRSFDRLFNVHLGGVWERLVRDAVVRRGVAALGGRARRCARWWGSGVNRAPMELDVVAESADGRTLLVGEAKLALTGREAERVRAELAVKAALLPFAKDYDRVVTQLFVAKNPPNGALSAEWLEGGGG